MINSHHCAHNFFSSSLTLCLALLLLMSSYLRIITVCLVSFSSRSDLFLPLCFESENYNRQIILYGIITSS